MISRWRNSPCNNGPCLVVIIGVKVEVVIRRQRPVVRDRDPDAVDRAGAEGRHQHAGLALHGRVGRREVRKIGEGNAEKLELRVLEIHHLLVLIMDDPHRLHLPFRRFLRIVLALLAGSVDAVLEDGEIAGRAFRARGGETGVLGSVDPQRIDEAVAIVVAEIHDLAAGDHATLGQYDISLRMQALGLLVVDHPIGFEGRVAIVELYIADRRHAFVAVVVIDLGRPNEHLLLLAFRLGRSGPVAAEKSASGRAMATRRADCRRAGRRPQE